MAGSRTISETREVEWVDCPDHGTAQPRQRRFGLALEFSQTVPAELVGPFLDWDWGHTKQYLRTFPTYVGGQKRTHGYCATEGCLSGALRVRKVRVPKLGSKTKLHECNGACLGGRISCECKCGGKCHGAGGCSCA